MTASENLICFLVWPFPETAIVYNATASWVPYQILVHTITLGDTSFPLCGDKVLHPAQK